MDKYINADQMLKEYEHSIYDTTDLAEMLYYMPAADVEEVRHGKWTMIDKGHHFYDWECSVCGGSGRADYAFCPNCGARMDEVKEWMI